MAFRKSYQLSRVNITHHILKIKRIIRTKIASGDDVSREILIFEIWKELANVATKLLDDVIEEVELGQQYLDVIKKYTVQV